jgi:hypothetical protein
MASDRQDTAEPELLDDLLRHDDSFLLDEQDALGDAVADALADGGSVCLFVARGSASS